MLRPRRMTTTTPGLPTRAETVGLVLAAFGLAAVDLPSFAGWWLPAVVLGLAIWAWAAGAPRWRWSSPAIALLAWAWATVAGPAELGTQRWRDQLGESYVQIWERLDAAAERAADEIDRLAPPSTDIEQSTDEEVRALFDALAASSDGETLLLVRNAGQVVAWAGPAMPMDLGGEGSAFAAALPTRGGPRAFVRPASATLTISKPLGGDAWRGWLVAAGLTFDSTRLPWPSGPAMRWSVDEGGGPSAGVLPVEAGEWPDLWVARDGQASSPRFSITAAWLALLAVGMAVLITLGSESSTAAVRWLASMVLVGSLLAISPAPVWVSTGWLIAGLAGYLAVGWIRRFPPARAIVAILALGPGLATLGASFVTLAVGTQGRPAFQIAGLRPIGDGTWLLLALTAVVALMLYRIGVANRRADRLPAWTAVTMATLSVVAAAVTDQALLVLPLCLGLVALLMRHQAKISDAATLVLTAALMATLWTASERLTVAQAAYSQRHLASVQTGEGKQQLRQTIEESLDGRDVLSLSLGQTSLGSIESLAYGLWLGSALDTGDLDSVLAVTSEGRPLSAYEAGLPRTRLQGGEAPQEGAPPARPLLGPASNNPEPVEYGSGKLLFNGAYFADLEFAWRPQPGYRWYRATRLSPPVVVAPASATAATLRQAPGLLGDRFSHLSADGRYRLTLPPLGVLASLERVAGRTALALSLIAILLGLAHSGLIADRWRRRIEALRSSYPRRLALTLGGLILVPLLLVNLAILTLHERDLRAERERIEQAALESARQAIYTRLDSLPPNFALNTALNDDVLTGFASIVGRPVDLYWNSGLYASSRRNRFDSQELGGRLPAPVYSRLVLGDGVETRHDATVAGGEVAVYASLERFDTATGPNLILAVPVAGKADELTEAARSLRSRTLLIGFAVLALAFWATARAARNFSRPILDMISGTERIAAGADSLGIELPREQDLGRLAAAIDRMAADVAALQRSERIERDLVEQILANVTTGVVLIDDSGRIGRTNPVATQMLGVEVGQRLPEDLGDPLAGLAAFSRPEAESAPTNQKVTVEIEGEARQWQVARIAVESPAGRAWLLVVEDVTEVVRGERLAAWAEMARIIAHEIKNPLTPIRLSAEHLREVFRPVEDPHQRAAVERCTSNILSQVEDLRQIANEFSDYSRIPEIRAAPFVVSEWIAEVVASYQPDVSERRIDVDFDLVPKLTVDADRRLLTRVLRNLLENSLRAAGGAVVSIQAEVVADGKLQISILDRGPGVADGDLDRIFEPYFSTHEAGTGLGLPISRRIVEAHGGSVEARRRDGGGLCVVVRIPLEPEGPLAG